MVVDVEAAARRELPLEFIMVYDMLKSTPAVIHPRIMPPTGDKFLTQLGEPEHPGLVPQVSQMLGIGHPYPLEVTVALHLQQEVKYARILRRVD